MDEHKWAEQFERELNGLMGRGKKLFRQNYPGQMQPVLEMAKLCLETDFAPESRVRAQLLGKLLAKMDSELDELDLSRVVGGVAGPSAAGCTLCGCTRTASGMQEESCPECGHARSLHR